MTRAALLAAAAILLAVPACGDETAPPETTTVVVTEAETTPPEEDRAYLLALDFCANAPLETIALLRGGSPEDLAREFAQQIRPELREAALDGCLEGIGRRDRRR